MPIYEYKCERCSQKFEVIQKFADAPLTVHEECGGAVERLLSSPALQFKGSGWYITDYAKAGSGSKTSAGNNGSSSSNGSSSTESSSSSSSSSSSTSSTSTPSTSTSTSTSSGSDAKK